MEIEPWEASAYGNVHKYNHDVYPAKTALGINGCTDCHSLNSNFFFANVVQYPFDDSGSPIYMKQHRIMDLNGVMMTLGAVRETYFKPTLYILLLMLCCIFIGYIYKKLAVSRKDPLPAIFAGRFAPLLVSAAAFVGVLIILLQPNAICAALSILAGCESLYHSSCNSCDRLHLCSTAESQEFLPDNMHLCRHCNGSRILILIKLPWIDFLKRISYTDIRCCINNCCYCSNRFVFR